ncbi:tRNA lysidine(34) synthetase TilS [Verrucomicrobia bacterium]|nr:tRNA lysidine(34) synthetase TilS [Verrucomicrobiota bacterium]
MIDFEEFTKTGPLPKGEPVLVAVSGGVDSMVLLHALRGSKIVVAHFNHKLRGESSDADQKLVEKTACKLNAAIVLGQWEPDKEAIHRHGLEMAARKARLRFLEQAAKEHQCNWVAMAHHADDQVETFFWRLLRGAGGTGLRGMTATALFPGNPNLQIARPLLRYRKTEILSHAKTEGVLFREDESNVDPAHLRNRIRNRLLPLLCDEFHPETNSAILQSMELVGADADCVKVLAANWLTADAPQPFKQLHPAIQRQVIWHQLIAHNVEPGRRLIAHLQLRPGQSISLSPTQTVYRDANGLLNLNKVQQKNHPTESMEWTLQPGWNESTFCGTTLRCRTSGGKHTEAGPDVEFFDADQVGPCVVLRNWRPGDRFEPIGLGHAASLQNLFTNAKVPVQEKRKRVIACTVKGEIFWVQGLRIGQSAKVQAWTTRFLEWCWTPAKPA